MRLRPATLDDLDAVHRIRRLAILDITPGEFSAEDLRAWATRRRPAYFAPAVQEGRITLAVLDTVPVAWAGRAADKITGLYVHPDTAGQGMGRLLMEYQEKEIAAAGHPQAILAASLNAVGFYERLGYRKRRPQSQGGSYSMHKRLVS